MNSVQGQATQNKEEIEEMKQRELLNIREELEMIRNRPIHVQHLQNLDNRETITFKHYKRNPLEFLERVEEQLARNRENRWTVIRGMLDEYFKEIHDNWWTATRHDIQDYAEFRTLFKACLLYTSRCV